MKTELEKREILRLSNEQSNKVTKECLRIAMIKLMDKKPFEKISITELTQSAGVSRTAFYRNYASKEALVEDICQSLSSELQASVSGDLYRTDRRNWYIQFFRTIRENSEYFQIYLNAHLQFGDMIVLESVFPASNAAERYLNSAKEGAFLRVLTDWFCGGMQESPDEMGEICVQVIQRNFELHHERNSQNEI